MEKTQCFKIIQEIEKGEKISLTLKEYSFLICFLVHYNTEFSIVSKINWNKVELFKQENEDEKVDDSN